MEIILKEDIKGLGYKNDIVTVKPGYGRNFLIPQGFAIIGSPSNKKMITENVRQAAHKAEKIKQDAEELAKKIGESAIEIKTKAGESGKIFGAVTALQISDALAAKGFEVDRKKIGFNTAIKSVGEYGVTLDLHKEVKHEVTVNVVAE
ncbi:MULTISPECIES: 50S ribosomal protein L9 [Reichenbachiella]|uniref:Large ribosomal subunit protein bL9 n=1 Tax=Reichenbachiella agariperforans TaxID=156994 RepID=A0A1M6SNW0_REIAG|nr:MULTISPECIES: 50S ribosomal protein L9 [Reichenbachiella]MBU2916208.1 50S ribosomal protein L9 [Reichenbachiella agariperforans]RJE75061.1 50S ribosomal protein L9 [Reichenbachiella sp. MSK19-1]SHK46346.1 LSU ribosomal protein L9P [Reichenbachiella agariperforans]